MSAISFIAECTASSVMTVSTAQLFIQAVSEEPSVCIKSCCPLPHLALPVAYTYFIKSAAQRLGPTLPLSGRQGNWGGEAES
jgi:hypothetical protein